MKGVIMAGGKGTRLRPLTCQLPKPMVPLLNKPVMAYSIELLKKHGVTDIAVTVQYLSEAIRDYFGDGSQFGVNLVYFEETTPLGTAGSVKQAEAFLDEPFIVVSGDALTDFDLQTGIEFHQEKKGLVSFFMKTVECPYEFGVIMTDEEDKITRFIEKPSPDQVFSHTVNTGIYIMNPEIFSLIEKDTVTDFSKDVFPFILESSQEMYGFESDGYWSDIGSLAQYRQAQFDLLSGNVQAKINGIQRESGVWVAENAIIEEGANIEGPVIIGENSVIQSGAHVAACSVIGANVTISNRASLKRSIVWDGSYIGNDTELRGATICDLSVVGEGVKVFEDVVIGYHTQIGNGASIQPKAKIWPFKEIEAETSVHASVVWNEQGAQPQPQLTGYRAIGIANVGMTPEHVTKLGAAFGSLIDQGESILVASDSHPFSKLIKLTFSQSLRAAGLNIIDLDESIAPVLRYSLEQGNERGGAYVRLVNRHGEKRIVIEFFDEEGMPISKRFQKSLEQAFTHQSYRRIPFEYAGRYEQGHDRLLTYEDDLIRPFYTKRTRKRIHVVLQCRQDAYLASIPQLLEKLDCEVEHVPLSEGHTAVAKNIREKRADLGIVVGESGEFLLFLNEKGESLLEEEQLSLYVHLQMMLEKRDKMAIPLYASQAFESMGHQSSMEFTRSKSSAREMMRVEGTVQTFFYDGPFALVHLIQALKQLDMPLSEWVTSLNAKFVLERDASPKADKQQEAVLTVVNEAERNKIDFFVALKVN
ncbi:sugar phosphate nucleotidyltransferase [Halalkalibacterium ligniniphilum]|uniref:sugar phosphate nucleotidyltransferase n=1 Tax=Halalkalibacterium ligniniphilum TaxID=1134413 RepID=UPI00034B6A8B|nr:sugar phosphate nucleotidyltransferase [Halalkalibacterium ligniniphilum]